MDLAQVENKVTDEIIPNRNLTRFKKRFMKRQWEDNTKKADGETEEKRTNEKTERIKRKKMAVLLGYSGIDYYGMQR